MEDGAGAPPPPLDGRRFERMLEQMAARRELAEATLRRMREAVERSHRLLQETAGVLTRVRPPTSDGDPDPPGEAQSGA